MKDFEKVMIGTLEVNPVFINPPFIVGRSYANFMRYKVKKAEILDKEEKTYYKCLSFGKWRIYITHNIFLRRRSRRDKRRDVFEQKSLRHAVYERSQGICECCGKPVSLKDGQMHHILPVQAFKELCCDMNNTQLLCYDCHKRVHSNPFLDLRQQLDKAEEYGIDLYKHYGNEK